MPAIAVFDLDGTLCRGDTFRSFLLFMLGRRPARWWRVPLLGVAATLYGLRLRDNSWLKGVFLRHVIGGLRERDVAADCDRFLRGSVRSRLSTEGLKEVSSRKLGGALVVLATASPDVYVERLAAMLDIEHVVCTRLERGDGRFTGRMIGGNCHGPEKHRRVDAFRLAHGAEWADMTCYSDHVSDLGLLRQAGHAYAVNPSRAFAAACRRQDIAVVAWT
ncbi:MAG TPA: HAD-IB family hydrolase [Xanthobacteraceae bacterium]|jgi:HAD superfamily hydrolase (TIGR01490 family)|nr:HAD-IB family hydrolase [Xanthobacteraceae bacterium]